MKGRKKIHREGREKRERERGNVVERDGGEGEKDRKTDRQVDR